MRHSARLGGIMGDSHGSGGIFAYSTDSEGAADSAQRPLSSIGVRAEKKLSILCIDTNKSRRG